MEQQLTLPLIPLPEDEVFSTFYPNGSEMAIFALHEVLKNPETEFIYLWGGKNTGKTHLLHSACSHNDQLSLPVALLPLTQRRYISPEMVEGLEELSLVCIDDIDEIACDDKWELAIFDLFNRIKEKDRATLIITGNQPPKELGIKLPDLISRLSWGEIYQLSPLKDEDKLQALQLRALQRGFELPEEVALFLVKRVDRDLRTLFEVLNRLDRASLEEKRLISVPFVKKVLSL
ncbi:DnaA inactivator Hda [Thorsellia anophelis]|uniref:Regulatory inactivation of DnaA Hda protein n=1 Tax=Thorsellia anophelis DSM 18579 TaxID=1123402 RepID=A0A1I0F3W2_9GAMM|nr:DnaA inactivator Hda [Thorsellia anophelis]SET52729.1 regulatory inactivation of DnaA Hda protein [Thorsellia anophelis DSM 18579]